MKVEEGKIYKRASWPEANASLGYSYVISVNESSVTFLAISKNERIIKTRVKPDKDTCLKEFSKQHVPMNLAEMMWHGITIHG